MRSLLDEERRLNDNGSVAVLSDHIKKILHTNSNGQKRNKNQIDEGLMYINNLDDIDALKVRRNCTLMLIVV